MPSVAELVATILWSHPAPHFVSWMEKLIVEVGEAILADKARGDAAVLSVEFLEYFSLSSRMLSKQR